MSAHTSTRLTIGKAWRAAQELYVGRSGAAEVLRVVESGQELSRRDRGDERTAAGFEFVRVDARLQTTGDAGFENPRRFVWREDALADDLRRGNRRRQSTRAVVEAQVVAIAERAQRNALAGGVRLDPRQLGHLDRHLD